MLGLKTFICFYTYSEQLRLFYCCQRDHFITKARKLQWCISEVRIGISDTAYSDSLDIKGQNAIEPEIDMNSSIFLKNDLSQLKR